MYNMTMTGGLGLLSISTEGDQQWTAEISNITHTMRLSLQADCGDAGQVLSSRLEYEETRLEMHGLDRSVISPVSVFMCNFCVQRLQHGPGESVESVAEHGKLVPGDLHLLLAVRSLTEHPLLGEGVKCFGHGHWLSLHIIVFAIK